MCMTHESTVCMRSISDPGVPMIYSGSPSHCNCLASAFHVPRRCASATIAGPSPLPGSP